MTTLRAATLVLGAFATGCLHPPHGYEALTDFRVGVHHTMPALHAFYASTDAMCRVDYLERREADPSVALAPNTADTAPEGGCALIDTPLAPEAIDVRLRVLDALERYVEHLYALSEPGAGWVAHEAMHGSEHLGTLGEEIAHLEGSGMLPADVRMHLEPLIAWLTMHAATSATREEAVRLGTTHVMPLIGALASDAEALRGVMRAHRAQLLDQWAAAYQRANGAATAANATTGPTATNERVAVLSRLHDTLERYDHFFAADPRTLIDSMGVACEAMLRYAQSPSNDAAARANVTTAQHEFADVAELFATRMGAVEREEESAR